MKHLPFLLIMASTLFTVGCNQEKTEIKTEDQKVSYGIGLSLGKTLKQQGMVLDASAVAAGVHDATTDAKPRFTEEEIAQVMKAKQEEIGAEKTKAAASANEKSTKESADFLAANKAKPGVKTTASGLQYRVIKEGTGKKPTKASTVTVNYRGKLVNGTEFDSSYKRNEPATFPVSGVIPGWTEGLQLMNEGSTYEFVIPANLAYGANGTGGGLIPGNAALVFEVELIKAN